MQRARWWIRTTSGSSEDRWGGNASLNAWIYSLESGLDNKYENKTAACLELYFGNKDLRVHWFWVLLPSLFSIPFSSSLQLLWLCSAFSSYPLGACWLEWSDFYASGVFCHQSFLPCFSLCLSPTPSIYPSCSPPVHIHLSLSQVGELIALSSWKKAASGDIHWSTGVSGPLLK